MASPAQKIPSSEEDELIESYAELAKKSAPRLFLAKRSSSTPIEQSTSMDQPNPKSGILPPKIPATGSTEPTFPSAQDNKLKQEFDRNWETFLEALKRPT